MKITVCKDCADRYPACHDVCDRYNAEKEKGIVANRALMAAMRAERSIDWHKYEAKIKAVKRHKK